MKKHIFIEEQILTHCGFVHFIFCLLQIQIRKTIFNKYLTSTNVLEIQILIVEKSKLRQCTIWPLTDTNIVKVNILQTQILDKYKYFTTSKI